MPTDIRPTIVRLMREKGFSQRALAATAGVDQPSLSKYLGYKTNDIALATAVALARALEVTVSELVGESAPYNDRKIATVVYAMEHMPEYKKDVVVASSVALTQSDAGNNPNDG